jgi:hypothetical protein
MRYLQKKRVIASLLAAVMALSLLAVPALAEGEGNIDSGDSSGGGSGMGEGTKQNYWNNEDGCRITILKDGQKVYSMDWSNQPEATSVRRSFAPRNKLDYLHGVSLSINVNQYKSTVVAKKMPTIVGGNGGNNIDAIKRYFTSELIAKVISDGVGIPYDDLTGGHYKLLLEPIAYFTFKGVKWAMTATEAAEYDVLIKGQLRAWMKSLTHQNLPLSMFLEKDDTELNLEKWTGAKSGKQTNANIIHYLGMGIVSFKATPPVTPATYDYEFRTDTDVIVSFPISSSSEINPDNNAYVTLNIGEETYRKSFICPAGGTQLIWIRWHTPSDPQQLTATATGAGNPVTLNINVVKLEEKAPPDPTYYDRNDNFTLSPVPDYGNNLSTTWGEWYARWIQVSATFGYWYFYYVTYEASLVVHDFTLKPDERCQTDYQIGNGQTTMKSGYGVEVSVEPLVQYGSGVADYDVTPIQNAVSTFPEFGYETYDRLLEKVDARNWMFKQNPCSYYANRIHYTPIWFPDGDYTVPVCVFDSWTPGGQLYATVSDTLNIFGDVLDDWYIHVVE